VIHAAVRFVAALWRSLMGPRVRVESFVGSTLQDTDPAYAPTRVLLPWPRRKDRP
jgi:hypothetical protein